MKPLFIDLETQSECDLTKVGPRIYAKHPSTSVLCIAWSFGDDRVHVWKRGDDLVGSTWWEMMFRGDVPFVAHNIEFERWIIDAQFGVGLPPEKWIDTMATAAAFGLPRSLEDAAVAMRLGEGKDVEGQRIMMKLSRPRKPSVDNPALFWDEESKPDDFEKLYNYCAQDVRVMVELWKRLPSLSIQERKIWEMTVRMNDRGVAIDTAAIPLAREMAKQEETRLANEFEHLLGVKPNSPKASKILHMDSLDKLSVRRRLTENITDVERRALLIRQEFARSSVKKLKALEERTSPDGRLRGSLIYGGAERTLRWSSGGVQVQNFPRGLGKGTEAAFQALHGGALDFLYDDVLGTLSNMLRGFFLGPLLVGDFAQVEARVTAWIAKQKDLLATFATGADPYRAMASSVYNIPAAQVSKEQRFMGKQAILGCGFGMGADKFMRMLDETYDVRVEPEFAQQVIRIYRRKYTDITKTWEKLDDAVKFAIRKKSAGILINKVVIGTTTKSDIDFLWIQLPSGRKLYYADPEISLEDDTISYYGRNPYKGGQWERVHTWGGKILENIVQATSRDLLAEAMLRLELYGFKLILTIHDEVVAEDDNEHSIVDFENILKASPSWASDLPVGVECFECGRYQK